MLNFRKFAKNSQKFSKLFNKVPIRSVANYDPTKDYYKILEITQTADEKEIKIAYYKLAKKYHPDLTKGQTTEKFKEINQAYEVLSDKDKKLQYDASRKFNSFWGGKTYSQQQQNKQSNYSSNNYTGNTYNNYNYGYGNSRSGTKNSYQDDPFSKNFNDWFKGFREKYSTKEDYKSNFSGGKKYGFSKKYYEKNKNYFASFERKEEDQDVYQKPKEKKQAQFGKKYYQKNKQYYDSFKREGENNTGDNSGYYNQSSGGSSNPNSFVFFVMSIAGVILGSMLISMLLRGNRGNNAQVPYQREQNRQRRALEANKNENNVKNQNQTVQEPVYSSYTAAKPQSTYNFERMDKSKTSEAEHGMKDDPFYRK